MPNLRQNASLPQLNVHSKNITNLTVEGCFILPELKRWKYFNLCKIKQWFVLKSFTNPFLCVEYSLQFSMFWCFSPSRLGDAVSAVLRRIATVGSLPNVCRVCSLHNTKENCKSLLTKCRGSVSLDLCIVPEFSIYSQNISTVNTRFRYHLGSAEKSGKRVKLTKNAKIKFCIFTSRLEMLRANRNCFQIKPILVI